VSCLKCKTGTVTTYTPFCNKCLPGWVKSDERAQIDWVSDESYNLHANMFANKIEPTLTPEEDS
jgi:hypothetical protein